MSATGAATQRRDDQLRNGSGAGRRGIGLAATRGSVGSSEMFDRKE
jgi:hypothetical protein